MKETNIIAAIDRFLERTGIPTITAVSANKILADQGLLYQSKTRRGTAFRKMLRAGLIPHAYQLHGKGTVWIIPHS